MNTPSTSPSPSVAPSPSQPARALLKDLQEKFVAFREYMPLTIGIDKQLFALYPEVSRKTLRVALGIHTNSLRYLKIMEKAKNRVDLEGNAAEEVTDLHRAHATTVLRERAKKVADQRKAQRALEEAALAVKAAEEAARQTAEKMQQLASKFSRKG
ncbi:MAG: ProQ/FINO family protein [Undibacterium sp.]|nr:ProQ/FINO family protein [Undibacterium sp.]